MNVLDLFAGCGGLSLGLESAGHVVVAACEKDDWAADTYRGNFGRTTLLHTDISTCDNGFWSANFRGQVDMVVGGPPCQGFSVSGKRQYGVLLRQNRLVCEFLRVVESVRPQFVLFENVGGFRTGRIDETKGALGFLKQELQTLDYAVRFRLLQAAEYGVPSIRSRLLVVGSLQGFDIDPFPDVTHGGLGDDCLQPYTTVRDAIWDLPTIEAGEGTEGRQDYRCPPQGQFQAAMRVGAVGVFNHVAMRHTPRLVDRFSGIPQGGCSYHIGRRERADSSPVTIYKSNNQRLREDRPSLCITANFQSTYVHPAVNRNLTAREAARLMTFPDRFVFRGKRTLMSSTLLEKEGRHAENFLSQYNQIGNAIPPLLAQRLGEHLGNVFELEKCHRTHFPVTGLSPASHHEHDRRATV